MTAERRNLKTKVIYPKTARRTSRAFSPGDGAPRGPRAPRGPALSTFLGEKRRLSQALLAPLKTLIAIHYWLLLNDYNVGVTILSHSIRRGEGAEECGGGGVGDEEFSSGPRCTSTAR